VLQSLGVRRAMVVCGSVLRAPGSVKPETARGNTPDTTRNPQPVAAYLDELSSLGPNTIAEFYQERGLAASILSPESFPLQRATLADLLGGDRQANAEIVRRILRGDERGPKRDAVLLNAAAALFVAGKVKSLSEGWGLAAETVDSGRAAAKLADLTR